MLAFWLCSGRLGYKRNKRKKPANRVAYSSALLDRRRIKSSPNKDFEKQSPSLVVKNTRVFPHLPSRTAPHPTTLTESPKIILYYRLSRSTWPLSNNKEIFCRLCQIMPGKSLTTGSRYVLSPHEGGTRVHYYIT
jgi:hypothetical protein